LLATLALILVGVGLATHFERRKLALADPNDRAIDLSMSRGH
jgi:hypothetical protein